jgi:hypothetical protein
MDLLAEKDWATVKEYVDQEFVSSIENILDSLFPFEQIHQQVEYLYVMATYKCFDLRHQGTKRQQKPGFYLYFYYFCLRFKTEILFLCPLRNELPSFFVLYQIRSL